MDSLAYLSSLEALGIKFGLDNIRALCRALGDPQRRFRSVLVAGTNGKGSVSAMVASALRAAGYHAARYTSPHLVHLEERFWIGGGPVSPTALRRSASRVQAASARLMADGELSAHPTFFEACTATAFLLFDEAQIELAVLEVGLGGRLDATNCVEPIAGAITSIGLDHESLLGSSLTSIAFEKAGIVRPGIPVVVGEMSGDAFDVIDRFCQERGARLLRSETEVDYTPSMAHGKTVMSSIRSTRQDYPDTVLGLRGRHQAANAAVAICLLEALEYQGFTVPPDAIVSGLQVASWRGRLELVRLADGRSAILDAAHNPAGARALASYLDEVYPTRLPIVFGAMGDKDLDSMLSVLAGRASRFVFTRSKSRRAASVDELMASASRAAPQIPADPEDRVADALSRAWQFGSSICVAGSIYLIGDVVSRLDGMSQPEPL